MRIINLHETTTLKLSILKAKERLLWTPKWGFEKLWKKHVGGTNICLMAT